MDPVELLRLRRRVRWAYELARLRGALLGAAPVLAVVIAAAYFGHRSSSTLGFGAAAVAAGVGMLWYGRDPQRAVLPGVMAGLVPLVLALCANQVHACGVDGCTTLCVPACAVGGVVAGLAVAGVGNQRKAGPWFWVSASALALLTGSMGCACIGSAGVVGLGLGFGAGMVPGLLRRAFG